MGHEFQEPLLNFGLVRRARVGYIPIMQGAWREGSSIALVGALAHAWLAGAVIAALPAHDHDDALRHNENAAIELILHGHDHAVGTPEHQHAFVSAKPFPQYLKRCDLPDPPYAMSHAIAVWASRIPPSVRRQPELSGPSPPSRNQTLVVLRI